MHTIVVISGGLVLLAVMVLIARVSDAQLSRWVLAFIPIWFVAAGINMYIGVSQAGYTVAQEAPIFLLVFGLPAAIAIALWRRWI